MPLPPPIKPRAQKSLYKIRIGDGIEKWAKLVQDLRLYLAIGSNDAKILAAIWEELAETLAVVEKIQCIRRG
jgi:hypothetical protein